MKTLTLGISPCPNDTYIFDALINGRINTHPFRFETTFADVEELNRMAGDGQLDITKLSVGAFADVSSRYLILDSGSALGNGVGPLLVSRSKTVDLTDPSVRVAIPGRNTTANLLLSIFFPHLKNKFETIFSEIESIVLNDESDVGLLIHEGRFTYAAKGLHQLHDLGDLWEQRMHMPLPLGCIVALRKMPPDERVAIDGLIRRSLEFAFAHPMEGREFVKGHAQEMDNRVIDQHINLYVNEYSLNLGLRGRSAISFLINEGVKAGLMRPPLSPMFNTAES